MTSFVIFRNYFKVLAKSIVSLWVLVNRASGDGENTDNNSNYDINNFFSQKERKPYLKKITAEAAEVYGWETYSSPEKKLNLRVLKLSVFQYYLYRSFQTLCISVV